MDDIYPADELADLLAHGSEVLAGQRTQKIVQCGSVLDNILQQSIRTKQTTKDGLNTSTLDASRHQFDVVAEQSGTQCSSKALWQTSQFRLEAPHVEFATQFQALGVQMTTDLLGVGDCNWNGTHQFQHLASIA